MTEQFQLPERQMVANIGSFLFNQPTESGYTVKVLRLRGWKDKLDIRREQVARLWGPGIFDEPGNADARLITIEARVTVPTSDAIRDLTNEFAALLMDGGSERFEVDDPIMGYQYATVSLANSSEANWQVPGIYPLQLHLLAADPKKYGQTAIGTTGVMVDGDGLVFDLFTSAPAPGVLDFGQAGNPGTITLTNTGTAPATPIFTVTGYCPNGFSIREILTDRTLRYIAAVMPGQTIRLDSADGSVTLDQDDDRSVQLVRREWTRLERGQSATWLFEAPGSINAKLRIEVTPAWW